jgi:hypothetical protein
MAPTEKATGNIALQAEPHLKESSSLRKGVGFGLPKVLSEFLFIGVVTTQAIKFRGSLPYQIVHDELEQHVSRIELLVRAIKAVLEVRIRTSI